MTQADRRLAASSSRCFSAVLYTGKKMPRTGMIDKRSWQKKQPGFDASLLRGRLLGWGACGCGAQAASCDASELCVVLCC